MVSLAALTCVFLYLYYNKQENKSKTIIFYRKLKYYLYPVPLKGTFIMEKLNTAVFLKVTETGSFKRAADLLGYTQAGISYIIGSMEEEFGLKLFHREYGGVRLTSEGEQLLPLIRQVADSERHLQQGVNDIRDLQAGTIRVSTFNSVYIHWLPRIIRKFRDQYPHIDIEIVSCEEDWENEKLIADREVDCGFFAHGLSSGGGMIDSVDLMVESLLVAVHSDHPMAGKKRFPRSKLGDYPYIMFSFDKPNFNDVVFGGGIVPRTTLTVDNDFAAMSMVNQGLGICIFPQLLVNDHPYNIRCLELDPPLHRVISIGTRSMDSCSRATREFIRCAMRWADEQDFSLSQARAAAKKKEQKAAGSLR